MNAPDSIQLTFCAMTNVGRVRQGNEDNFLVADLETSEIRSRIEGDVEHETTETQVLELGSAPILFAVSDGMGGALAGEVASRMAVDIVSDLLPQLKEHEDYAALPLAEQLRVSIEQANTAIHRESFSNPACRGMGATFTAAVLQAHQIFFAQVGDSRAYLIRNETIQLITKDQSVVQQLIDMGEITEEEAAIHPRRNIILQALGAVSEVDVVVKDLELCEGDLILLCSDGLSGKMSAEEMKDIVLVAENIEAACQSLIDLANDRGGEDNITTVLIKVTSEQQLPAEDTPIETEIIARNPSTPTEFLLEEIGDSPPKGFHHNKMDTEPLEDSLEIPIQSPPPIQPEHLKPVIDGKKLMIGFGIIVLLCSIGVIYLNKSFVGNRAILQSRLQTENQTIIAGLQKRIEALRQKPEQPTATLEMLDILTKRLAEASATDPTKYHDVGVACSEVENEIVILERQN